MPARRSLVNIPGRTAIEVAGLFLGALALYVYTLAPSLNWADAARLQMDVLKGGSTYAFLDEARSLHTDGLPFDRLGVAAWDHPLYVMAGHAFAQTSAGSPAWRVNLLSAICGAATIALLYLLASGLAGKWPALVGAIALAVSHTFWFMSVTSEVYTLNTLLLAALILAALGWERTHGRNALKLFALVAGLGLANHLLFGLAIVIWTAFVLLSRARRETSEAQTRRIADQLRSAGGVLLLFALGFAPWWLQFLRMARTIGVPLTLALASSAPNLLHRLGPGAGAGFMANLGLYLTWLVYQFTPLGVALGIWGMLAMSRSRDISARFLLLTFAGYAAFSANFTQPDRFNFHLPSFEIFAIAIAFGARELMTWAGERTAAGSLNVARASLALAVLVAPVTLYELTPRMLASAGVTEASAGINPVGDGARDTLRYFLKPSKRGDHSAARFGRSTLLGLAPNAIVLSPGRSEQETYVILRYFQSVEGLRPDVSLRLMLFAEPRDTPAAVLALVDAQAGCRPIYLTSLNQASFPVPSLEERFRLTPEANLYRLLPRNQDQIERDCEPLTAEWTAATQRQLILRISGWR